MTAKRIISIKELWYYIALWCVFTRIGNLAECWKSSREDGKPLQDFHHHSQVTPYVVHGRTKRHIQALPHSDGEHLLETISVGFDAFGNEYIVDLQQNRDLMPNSYFEKHHEKGKAVIKRPNSMGRPHCYYKGRLRNAPQSWAAISTCNGISGVFFDGQEMHFIEPVPLGPSGNGNLTHYVYRSSNMKQSYNFTCGYKGSKRKDAPGKSAHNRVARMANELRAPYNANRKSRYVELVLVNDNKEFKEMKGDVEAVYARSKEIANIANALYAPLNIFIALVGIVVWSDFNEISLSTNGDTTLTNFLYYRRERLVQEYPNDNAQLITGIQFTGGVVGKALKGPICTYEYSGGVNMDHSPLVGLVATTVAHELGHNFGMEHDEDHCECPEDRCIMAPSSSSTSPTHWSSCSLEYLNLAFDHGMDYCLRNKPDKVTGPVCGNGFTEEGEECDCGLKRFCDNPCCNATSCTLFANASCATGLCCNLKTCQVKPLATLCRDAYSDCDLPEFCDGVVEDCPRDVFKQDGISCFGNNAYCFSGQCKSHSDQCKLLWGPSGKMSDKRCFEQNKKGTPNGNCGYFRMNQTYKSCPEEDVLCGMLHCTHLNERLEFGLESVAILSRSFITTGDRVLACRSAMVDLGINNVDPGLAPDGSKCGEDKICVKQRCIPVGSLKTVHCAQGCSGNGVCNSNGKCHCNAGYGPPVCDAEGPGGSEDSGPATDPNAPTSFAYTVYIVFLCVIAAICVLCAFALYFHRGHIKAWWISKARKIAIKTRAKDAAQWRRPPSRIYTDKNDIRALEISSPVPAPTTSLPTIPRTPISPPAPLTRTHSVKAAKLNLDRNSLRNLLISNPIPQSAVNIPTVPTRPAPPRPLGPPQIQTHEDDTKVVRPPSWGTNPHVSRQGSTTSKSNIAGGSTRVRRLSSGSFRPTNPPPRPPIPKAFMTSQVPSAPPIEQEIYASVIYSEPQDKEPVSGGPVTPIPSFSSGAPRPDLIPCNSLVGALTKRFESRRGTEAPTGDGESSTPSVPWQHKPIMAPKPWVSQWTNK